MPLTVDFGNGTFESSSLSSDCAAAATGSAVRWGSIPTVWNLINDHATYNPLSDDFIWWHTWKSPVLWWTHRTLLAVHKMLSWSLFLPAMPPSVATTIPVATAITGVYRIHRTTTDSLERSKYILRWWAFRTFGATCLTRNEGPPRLKYTRARPTVTLHPYQRS